jgi:hypothetical protein
MMVIAPSADRNPNGVATLSVLARYSGWSSLKFGFYKLDASRIETRLAGEAEGLGPSNGRYRALDDLCAAQRRR